MCGSHVVISNKFLKNTCEIIIKSLVLLIPSIKRGTKSNYKREIIYSDI